jgi:hypothetical protein
LIHLLSEEGLFRQKKSGFFVCLLLFFLIGVVLNVLFSSTGVYFAAVVAFASHSGYTKSTASFLFFSFFFCFSFFMWFYILDLYAVF